MHPFIVKLIYKILKFLYFFQFSLRYIMKKFFIQEVQKWRKILEMKNG